MMREVRGGFLLCERFQDEDDGLEAWMKRNMVAKAWVGMDFWNRISKGRSWRL